jgi:replicative DNA helicase
MKQVSKVHDHNEAISKLYDIGLTKGYSTGFVGLDELVSVKLGATTYVYGAPYSGKSEFWFQILVNLSKQYGLKHIIFSPETGTPAEIFAEILHKWSGLSFFEIDSKYGRRMTEAEMFRIQQEVGEFFYIIDPGIRDVTMDDFYKLIDETELEHGCKISTITTDPFNEVKHLLEGEARDMYMERVLGKVRAQARERNVHHCIVMHVSNQKDQQMRDKDSGTFYYPPADPRRIANGEAAFRKGEQMICVYRPNAQMNDADGIPFAKNEAHLIVQKSKPKGVGQTGQVTMYFDSGRNQYYEFVEGRKQFSFKEASTEYIQPEPLTPSKHFNPEPNDTEVPF